MAGQMMDPRAIEAVIARRFGLPRAPTLVARVAASKLPVVFTHLQSAEARPRRTADVPREQSFSFQVPLTPFPWQAWFAGEEKIVSPAIPGNAYLFDLSNNPTVGLNAPFSTVRLNILSRCSTRSPMNRAFAEEADYMPAPWGSRTRLCTVWPEQSLPQWSDRKR